MISREKITLYWIQKVSKAKELDSLFS